MSKLETKDKLIQIRVTPSILKELRDNALRNPGGGTLSSYLVYCGLNPPKSVGRPAKEEEPKRQWPYDPFYGIDQSADRATATAIQATIEGEDIPERYLKRDNWVKYYTEHPDIDEEDADAYLRLAKMLKLSVVEPRGIHKP